MIFALSFFAGLAFAFIISKFGYKLGLVDLPSARSSHDKPIPKSGGIGIPIAVGLTTFLFINAIHFLVALSLFLGLMAFINDKTEISVNFRLSLHFALGFVLIMVYKKGIIYYFASDYFRIMQAIFIATLLSIYIVATTNFFNFMDGINGIAGFEAVISYIFLGIFALHYKNLPEISLVAFSVALASTGFLLMNFPKANVFMGDVGSIFIGFFFAGLVVYLSANIKELLLLSVFQGLFYIDCTSTIFVRLINRENILKAHKKHLYQKFVHCLGWTHPKVTVYYSLVQLLICLLGFILFKFNIVFLIFLWLILYLFYWSILICFRLVKA